MTNDDFLWLGEVLTTKKYTYAKTMPQHPHWYTLRKDWERDADFVRAVQLIREHGYERKFYNSTFTSFMLNESYYWTMGEPIDKNGKPWTILINKAKRDCGADYDSIAGVYDSLFTEEEHLDENRHVFDIVGWKAGETVLDIGCGTGLFLEYNDCRDGYTGIDPSRGMLGVLKSKFGGEGKTLVCTDFERFYLPEKFDKVVATFGSASYIEPSTIARVRHFIADGGKAFLMFYKDGYSPETYSKTGIEFNHHRLGEFMPYLGNCDVSEYHEFAIVEMR